MNIRREIRQTTSQLTMSNVVNLPEDIIDDILTRLPASSLGRFRCVSKQWRARISHPQFVKTHLSRSNKRARVLVFMFLGDIDLDGRLYTLDFDSKSRHNNRVGIAKELNLQAHVPLHVQGSCNGLVLIAVGGEWSLLLFNPTTQESKKLLVPPLTGNARDINYGLGYASGTDDYKVVRLMLLKTTVVRNGSNVRLDIYDTKGSRWRRLENLGSHSYYYVAGRNGIFVSGSLHWLAGRKGLGECYMTIVAFDLVEEKFREMPVPSDCVTESIGSELVVLDGCLSLKCRSEDVNNVWVMKEYGATGSWTRFTTSKLRVLCSLGDGKILLNDHPMRYFWCNLNETRPTEMMLFGLPQGRRFAMGEEFNVDDMLVDVNSLPLLHITSLGGGETGYVRGSISVSTGFAVNVDIFLVRISQNSRASTYNIYASSIVPGGKTTDLLKAHLPLLEIFDQTGRCTVEMLNHRKHWEEEEEKENKKEQMGHR
ncbi:hypothetical protein RJ640_014836 [Escallonia rubra]|uniref:F-box domain-containing protein n=1 Tax=Escallonia rubra TaxID=112253 RepID=A0AA88S8R4_9ASTE|nr:hypothetical protein RJ640_014836 [Escallonia rubra]